MACTDGDDGWETIPKKSRRIKKKADNGGCVKEEKVWTHSFEPIVEPPNCTNTPSILLLVGLPGSGKSTFSTELCRLLPWKYVRVNQDELKTRGKCIAAVEAALADGLSVVIDRCNFDRSQREPFVLLGKINNRANTIPVDCIVFDVEQSVCLRRCQRRRQHPTLGPGKAPMVVSRLAQQMMPPRTDEGFRTICHVGEQISTLEKALERLMEDALVFVTTNE